LLLKSYSFQITFLDDYSFLNSGLAFINYQETLEKDLNQTFLSFGGGIESCLVEDMLYSNVKMNIFALPVHTNRKEVAAKYITAEGTLYLTPGYQKEDIWIFEPALNVSYVHMLEPFNKLGFNNLFFPTLFPQFRIQLQENLQVGINLKFILFLQGSNSPKNSGNGISSFSLFSRLFFDNGQTIILSFDYSKTQHQQYSTVGVITSDLANSSLSIGYGF